MKLTRLYTSVDNESHFEDMGEIAVEDKGVIGQLSQSVPVSGFLIHQFDTSFQVEWYNPPLGKIYVIFLEGSQEISVGDGSSRVFGCGDILLAEDLSGRGHCTKALTAGKSIILTVS